MKNMAQKGMFLKFLCLTMLVFLGIGFLIGGATLANPACSDGSFLSETSHNSSCGASKIDGTVFADSTTDFVFTLKSGQTKDGVVSNTLNGGDGTQTYNAFVIDGHNKIYIDEYTGSATIVTFPAKVLYKGTIYPTRLCNSNGTFYKNKTITSITFESKIDFAIDCTWNMSKLFYGCSSLTTLDISGIDTKNATDMSDMFYDCKSLTTLDLSFFDTSNVTQMQSMFSRCSSLTTLSLSSFNTSKVNDMDYMFRDCKSLTTLDLSFFDTRKVTNMCEMFYGCSLLTSLDVSNFNTSKVIDMRGMFYGCSSLTTLDLSNFNTNNVVRFSYYYSDGDIGMFSGCSSLTLLDLSNFNTSKTTNMRCMFSGCSSLTTLDLSSFDTSNVTDMEYMFSGCSSLTEIDFSNFDFSKIKYGIGFAERCFNLKKIIMPKSGTKAMISSGYLELPTYFVKSNSGPLPFDEPSIKSISTNADSNKLYDYLTTDMTDSYYDGVEKSLYKKPFNIASFNIFS